MELPVTLRWRLPTLICAVFVTVLAGFAWFEYRQVEDTLFAAWGGRARAAADQLAVVLGQSAEQRINEVQRAAAGLSVRQYVESRTAEGRDAARQSLRSLTGPAQQIVELWSVDGERLLTIDSLPATGPVLPPGSMPGSVGVGPLQARENLVFSDLVVEIPPESKSDQQLRFSSLGYLVVRRQATLTPSPDVLNRLVGDGAVVEVGNRAGGVWTDFSTVLPPPPADFTTPGLARVRGGEGRGRRLGALADIRGTPWAIWVEFPRALVLALARSFLIRTIEMALFFAALAAVLARMLAARITTPLSELTLAAESMAAGDYARRVAADRDDEIGRLGQAFNAMTTEVQQTHQRLEARVHESAVMVDALRTSEAQYRAIVEVAFDSVITIDGRGVVCEFNPAAEKTFGYRRADALGRELAELIIPPSSREAHRKGLARYLATGEGPVLGKLIELTAMRSDGSEFPVDLAITPIAADGAAMFTGVIRDITQRKRAEEARTRLASIVETSDDAIISKTLEGFIQTWNSGAVRLYGYTAPEMIGRPVSVLIPPDRSAELPAILDRIKKGQSVEHYETVRQTKAGALVNISVTVSPLKDAEGRIVGASSIAHDITSRKQAERTLFESERRTQFALAAGCMGVWELELASGRVTWSDTPMAVFGLEWERAPRTHHAFLELIHSDDRSSFREAMEKALAERRSEYTADFRAIWPDGSVHWVESRARVLLGDQGKAVRVVGLGADVSERKILEQQLRQAQKMEAVGQLAGGVAHDFNNLLTAILGYSNFLLSSFDSTDPRRADVKQILAAGNRAADLTRQLLAFSRQQVLQPTSVDLSQLVTEMGQMFPRLIGEHIELVTALAADLAVVRADRGQLEQVLMNLVVNARDAMPSGGRLMIETAAVDLDASYAIQHVPVRAGPYVMLAVSDNGIGMDENTKRRMFEPFFTTKERGKGTGLGLATVYGIVKQSGGYVWVYSEVGHGATFKVYLPRSERETEVQENLTAFKQVAGGSETVLVVEDEEAVRFLTCVILEKAGYHVFGAANPQQAELMTEQSLDSVDLLVSDVIMPGSSGPALFGRLAEHRPDLKVLYVSGYTDEMIVHQGRLDPGVEFLQKPFTADGLTRRVREVLDR